MNNSKQKTNIMNFLRNIGHFFISFLQNIGKLSLFSVDILYHIFLPPYYPKQIFKQIIEIGYYSLPIVGLTALFSGMVLAIQSYTEFNNIGAEDAVISIVVLSITRELGPVLVGLMVAGRIGASIAAELSTMRVTEQIDELITLSIHPIKYLIIPKIITGLFIMPFLVLIADIIGIFGGYLVSVNKLEINTETYLYHTINCIKLCDIIFGLYKSTIFGFCITLLSCYNGYYAKGGAEGVGIATTNAVVSSSILILILNYILTILLFNS